MIDNDANLRRAMEPAPQALIFTGEDPDSLCVRDSRAITQEKLMVEQQLECPLCQGTDFDQESSRQDSKWGMTSHKMTLMICRRCRHVLHFSHGRSIFDFD